MRRRHHQVAAGGVTLTLLGALVLTGCGGAGSKDAAPKESAGVSDGTPSASAPAAAVTDRPKVVMPADVRHVYEGGRTGDPVKDAVLADNARNLEAIDTAITGDRASTEPALRFYNKDKALLAVADYIKSYYAENRSFVGTTRYYRRDVTVSAATATLTYCADATQTYPKDRRTGTVDRSVPGSASDYTFFTERLRKNDNGVWQSFDVTSGPGADKCA
ncbi:hypothetical protein ACFYM2_18740 [Streptomyces sp. NPDC006711]|uniref:hypothetical protein n=1 Tax=Streptomyces sp. NPDC006711 TaxID=3364762 RepID=UPI0036A7A018